MSETAPVVSVVIATYNRSNVLRIAIETVLRQTFADWECWVIGDCCTDDSAAVVASFGDPRIRFHNLPENIGEQSGPNNEGFRRSRGRYIAYLNHDDLWFPDHLAKTVAHIEATQADLVFALLLNGNRTENPTKIRGLFVGRSYEPPHPQPASSWVVRRELLDELGGWRFYQDIYGVPSQDLLVRAWKRKKRLLVCPHLTVIVVGSRSEGAAYADRPSAKQEYYLGRLTDPEAFRTEVLTNSLFDQRPAIEGYSVRNYLTRAARLAWRKLLRGLRIDLFAWNERRRYQRKGGRIDELRQVRGLPVIPRRSA